MEGKPAQYVTGFFHCLAEKDSRCKTYESRKNFDNSVDKVAQISDY